MNKIMVRALFLGGAIMYVCFAQANEPDCFSDLFFSPVNDGAVCHDHAVVTKNLSHHTFYAHLQNQRDQLLSHPEKLQVLENYRDICLQRIQENTHNVQKTIDYGCRLVDTYSQLLEYSMAYRFSVVLLDMARAHPTAFSQKDTDLINRVIKEYGIIQNFHA